MKKLLMTAAALLALVTPAAAAEKTMPIELVGDWCYASTNAPTWEYKLPSWIDDGHCKRILSIDKYTFYFSDEKKFCEPRTVQLSKDIAPSGTAYIGVVTARCYADGTVITPTSGQLRWFRFERYKGNLDVTDIGDPRGRR
jgi:hypothetical protein